MLALTRKKGESIMINNNIEISILEIRGDQIKIGISAPKDVPVYRKEVYNQIQEETKEALRAAETYLAIAVIGGMVMLMGLFLVYHELGTDRKSVV